MALPISGMSDAERARREGYIRGLLPAGVDIDLLISPGAPKFLDQRGHFGDAVQAATEFFATVDSAAYGVVIEAGALDPGLAQLRSVCPVPVIGPGEASMYLASIVGLRLSVVTVDEHAVAATEQFLAEVPAKPPIASIRSMESPVRGILDDLESGRQRLIEECGRAVADDGAEALYLGSMTLGTLGVAENLQQALGVPVFNPFPIAVGAAVEVLRAQSALS